MKEDNRIALIGIIIEQASSAEHVNQILHSYRMYIVGRMGIPYREKDVNIISVVLDAPETVISTLSGKLGMVDNVTVKAMFTKKK
jgi:putative iron-only hydrogenase system regulator